MDEIPLGKYRHYKGNQYEVVGFAKHSETLEDMVIYKALYGEGGIWVRPLSMWGELVEIDGEAVRRFEYADDKTGTARQDELSEALRSGGNTAESRRADVQDICPQAGSAWIEAV